MAVVLSSKNALQEFCQRKGLGTPVYTAVCVGGPPHDPQWVSSVSLDDGSRFHTEVCSSRKAAEARAAAIALEGIAETIVCVDASTFRSFPSSTPLNFTVQTFFNPAAMAWFIALDLKNRVGSKYIIASDVDTSSFLVGRINSLLGCNTACAATTAEHLAFMCRVPPQPVADLVKANL